MATTTSFLELTKPALSELADISVLNGNFDKIDKFIKETGLGRGGYGVDSLDNATTFGLYLSNVGVPPIEGKVHWTTLVLPHNTTQTMVQIAYRSTSNPTSFATRRMTDGVWGEWEYINPPMNAGVEYRTVERWGGEPVYRKRLQHVTTGVGEEGKTTDIKIPHEITGVGVFVHVEGFMNAGGGTYRFPYLSSTGAWTAINAAGSENITVKMQGAWSGERTWHFDLAYTKA
jgi:hypothetical protein